MKVVKFLGCGILAGFVIFTAGCGLFDNKIPKEQTGTIPGAAGEPGNDLTIDGAAGKWGTGADSGSLGAKAGDWTPVPNLTFPTIYFAYDQDVVGVSERVKLSKVAKYLQDNPALGLIIEGHCDDRGSTEYNRALGERRAIAVKNYMVNLGIADSRMKTMSFGEDRPAVQGDTPAARTKNRRAELIPAKMK
jgi:peptidoglycan-associated lipoprotein